MYNSDACYPACVAQSDLKKYEDSCQFRFSQIFQVSSTILKQRVGSLTMSEIFYLVADDNMACEPILIGLPVLEHLRIDTSTLLEQQRDSLDDTDFSTVGNPTMSSKACFVSRLMTSRTQFPYNSHSNA